MTLVFAALVHYFMSVRVVALPLAFASFEDNGPTVFIALTVVSLAVAAGITSLCLTGVHGLNRRLGLGTVISAGFASVILWVGAILIGHRLGWF